MKKKAKSYKKMNSLEVFVDVEDNRWEAAIENVAAEVERVKQEVLSSVAKEVDFLELEKKFSLNLCLSDDASVQHLNAEFRHLDKPTNVLSFAALDDDDSFDDALENDAVVELGDVIIAYETMVREAQEQGVSLYKHFCHLWAHGLLHILGYDHIESADALEMETKEIEILEKLNIENPYQE